MSDNSLVYVAVGALFLSGVGVGMDIGGTHLLISAFLEGLGLPVSGLAFLVLKWRGENKKREEERR